MSDVYALDSRPKYIQPTQILPKVISSEMLMGRMRQVLILHEGETYQLRITKLGKLILTK
jgi:hemin uptake protein HemP